MNNAFAMKYNSDGVTKALIWIYYAYMLYFILLVENYIVHDMNCENKINCK